MITRRHLVLLAAFLIASLCGCRRIPEENELPSSSHGAITTPSRIADKSAPSAPVYAVPIRTDAELRTLFHQTCEHAQAANKPVLLDVGAAWCGDCRLLARMEQEEPLQSELTHFAQVSVNLGEDAHDWLSTAFKIHGIARWIVFRPTDCQGPVESWKALRSRVVEPATKGNETNASALVRWLQSARELVAEPRKLPPG